MYIYTHIHICMSVTSDYICLKHLWEDTQQPWLPLGRGAGMIFHCIPFVPSEFCTMYMYYLFKK